MEFIDFYYWIQDLFDMFTEFCLSVFNWLNTDITLEFLLGPIGEQISLNVTPLEMIFGSSIVILLTALLLRVFT